ATRLPAGGSAQAAGVGSPVRPPTAKTQGQRAADSPGGTATGPWGYAGPGGPASWGGACSTGQRQSPIDIKGGLAVDLEPVQFAYQGSRFGVVDNGHTVQVNMAAGNHIVLGGRRFDLQQFHFHRPSEERIDGRQFEMSVHLVHKDEQGRLAVVTVLLDKGPSQVQPVVQKVWNNLPLERGEEAVARAPLDLNELLPADRKYYTYMGSMTTPPCSEGVQWVVMRQPVTVTAEQIELFARIYPMNSRPLQSAAGRRILQSN
ncbi:MAG TPA: carbonic anhydrase family protein, partial [Rubrivivax sp.]|nr:carbonic anhydrase family protein [Rubrivivax sp.]